MAADRPSSAFYKHSSAQRVNTDALIVQAIRAEYPEYNVTIVPQRNCDLLEYATGGRATARLVDVPASATLKWREYIRPAQTLNGEKGTLADLMIYGRYMYEWTDQDFLLYVVAGRDGTSPYPVVTNQYVVGNKEAIDALILEAGQYTSKLHSEIWLYDQGYWQKSAQLWHSIQTAEWKNVILDEEMKSSLRDDVQRFYDAREVYQGLGVPWKRGIIFHGPPGNGKTISIKATMHMLYNRKQPVPTLYVKTLSGAFTPEYALGSIFAKARQEAPCYLVFEDLDSIVSDRVRSFFLNEVDGLQNNDGILMIGSTNHLERLDPGISKRPSRFDRKYFFPDPNFKQRVQYCQFWQQKLKSNKDLDFPDVLCRGIAKITHDFSFAYIQEAFVAALLVIAGSEGKGKERAESSEWHIVGDEDVTTTSFDRHSSDDDSDDDDDPKLDKWLLWREVRKQVAILRKELDAKKIVSVENQ